LGRRLRCRSNPRSTWTAHFDVSAKRLDDHERERTAAEMAWCAHGLLAPEVDREAIGWTPFLQQVLSEYVAITVDEDKLDRLDMWDQVIGERSGLRTGRGIWPCSQVCAPRSMSAI
jgi:hypothetical protein